MTNAQLNLACPSCKTQLLERNNGLERPGCQTVWPVVDGVPSFLQSADFWGEDGVTERETLELVRKSAGRDWRDVIGEMPAPMKHQHICSSVTYLNDLRQAAKMLSESS